MKKGIKEKKKKERKKEKGKKEMINFKERYGIDLLLKNGRKETLPKW